MAITTSSTVAIGFTPVTLAPCWPPRVPPPLSSSSSSSSSPEKYVASQSITVQAGQMAVAFVSLLTSFLSWKNGRQERKRKILFLVRVVGGRKHGPRRAIFGEHLQGRKRITITASTVIIMRTWKNQRSDHISSWVVVAVF